MAAPRSHSRHYTVEEANAALPFVRERIGVLRSAREGLTDEDARAALAEAGPQNGGGPAGLVVSRAFLAMQAALHDLQEREVVLRDLDRGLVDFPAMRGDREIYLCWEEGEDEVAFWHEPEAGFGGRRPLDDD